MTTAVQNPVVQIPTKNLLVGARAVATQLMDELEYPTIKAELMLRLAAQFGDVTEQADLLVDTLNKASGSDRQVLLANILAFAGMLETVTDHELSGRPLGSVQYERDAQQLFPGLEPLIDAHDAGTLTLQAATEELDRQYLQCCDHQRSLLCQVTLITMVLRSSLTPFRAPLGLTFEAESNEMLRVELARLKPLIEEIWIQLQGRSSRIFDMVAVCAQVAQLADLSPEDGHLLLAGFLNRVVRCKALEFDLSALLSALFCPGHTQDKPEQQGVTDGTNTRPPGRGLR